MFDTIDDANDLFLLTEEMRAEDELFSGLIVILENYGRERGALLRLSLAKMMISAAGADIRASIGPESAHEILQAEANDHWGAMKASRKRVA